MLYFKLISTVLEPKADGTPTNKLTWEKAYTFLNLRKTIRKASVPNFQMMDLAKAQIDWVHESHKQSNRPQFVWISYFGEPMTVQVRLISKKEYRAMIRDEYEANVIAWQEKGERKWGC